MEKLEGMISDIVFKNEENGYTIAYLANEDEKLQLLDVCRLCLLVRV